MTTRFLLTIPMLTFALLAVASPLQAQEASEPEALVMSASNLTAVAESAQGTPRENDAIKGGDVVRYSLLFTNVTDRPVRQIVLSNAVPTGFGMVEGSARASRQDVNHEYSADGGATWAQEPMETVLVDGKMVRRPISPDRFTHVRWTIDGWVAPQATVTADFDVRLAPSNR